MQNSMHLGPQKNIVRKKNKDMHFEETSGKIKPESNNKMQEDKRELEEPPKEKCPFVNTNF